MKRRKVEMVKRRKGEMAKRRNSRALVGDLCRAMEEIAPTWAAAEWDNVGLLVGSPDWSARRILLTIDFSEDVLDEAIRGRFDCVVSYHPPVFKPTPRILVQRATQEGVAAEALLRRIAIYSPHTALDAAQGGTNDTLAELCGAASASAFLTASSISSQCKLVVFVPNEAVERVAEAVFAAGAGRIGDYEKCGFRINGTGTFWGTDSTNPRVGQRGRLERVNEVRLETVFDQSRLAAVASAVRSAHPYEEPAFDVYPLQGLPREGVGQGRLIDFDGPVQVSWLGRVLAKKLKASSVQIVGDGLRRVKRGLVCVGSAGSLPFELGKPRFELVVTGEIRHHDALRYERAGVSAIALGHWASERPVLEPLAARLSRALSSATVSISRADHDPFATV